MNKTLSPIFGQPSSRPGRNTSHIVSLMNYNLAAVVQRQFHMLAKTATRFYPPPLKPAFENITVYHIVPCFSFAIAQPVADFTAKDGKTTGCSP
jgi:hypothetical protein